jgi:hypothetical protein
MRRVTMSRRLLVAVVLSGLLQHAAAAEEAPAVDEANSAPAASNEVTGGRRALQTARAVAANTLPVASALVEPKCIQGYILCKAMFAGFSVVAAAESLIMSGGADRAQPRGILTKGFTGDWVVTREDIAGTTRVDVLPEVAPSGSGGDKGGGFVPPPL